MGKHLRGAQVEAGISSVSSLEETVGTRALENASSDSSMSTPRFSTWVIIGYECCLSYRRIERT